ncbi:hypothetical protein GCM10023321_80510 [Pseudonocardia eucalypti]|uniref:ATP-grasp target RiPP n=1 Tax=Pseudonocardia eucalypti TaxID=648755 RepID=A0ABP9RCT1_9PSEU|nr:hypothetical protein [Pseudonocardia eucalypti]
MNEYDVMDGCVDGPLASVGLRVLNRPGETPTGSGEKSSTGLVPLALRVSQLAPSGVVPECRFDPVTQVSAQDDENDEPRMKKDWTTVEGTHTDGDGGDNESWGWEEV